MFTSTVLQKIAAGEAVLCGKACYHDPELVELIASSGLDAVWICLEHKRMDPATIYSLIQACRLGGSDAFIRVKPSNYTDLLHLLEAGARGIMLPRVTHPDEVREVVNMMRFPPVGRRGFDGIHADSNFGRKPAADYLSSANGDIFLAAQIEEPEVVPYIDEIAAMPGVDVLFVGPGDLTLGMGIFGKVDDPSIHAILKQVVEACHRHGKVAGIPCAPSQVQSYREMGFNLFNIISDYRCVMSGIKAALADACR